MKKTIFARMIAFAFIGILLSGHSFAQEDKSKRPSPPATATGTIGTATITIDYSSPSVKGRKIFGGLVPYDKVWRAGANEATIFTTDKPILVKGRTLAAGKYSLFAKPGEKEWTIYFNTETGQWGDKQGGDANMDPSKTAIEITTAPIILTSVQEKLLYTIGSGGFTLSWDNVSVPVSVK